LCRRWDLPSPNTRSACSLASSLVMRNFPCSPRTHPQHHRRPTSAAATARRPRMTRNSHTRAPPGHLAGARRETCLRRIACQARFGLRLNEHLEHENGELVFRHSGLKASFPSARTRRTAPASTSPKSGRIRCRSGGTVERHEQHRFTLTRPNSDLGRRKGAYRLVPPIGG
jgi:hypothetical protein